MRDWWQGTADGAWVSMGVLSDGSYGSPKDVIFSFPVTCKNHQWNIVQGLQLDDFSKGKIELTGQELGEERDEALAVCQG